MTRKLNTLDALKTSSTSNSFLKFFTLYFEQFYCDIVHPYNGIHAVIFNVKNHNMLTSSAYYSMHSSIQLTMLFTLFEGTSRFFHNTKLITYTSWSIKNHNFFLLYQNKHLEKWNPFHEINDFYVDSWFADFIWKTFENNVIIKS